MRLSVHRSVLDILFLESHPMLPTALQSHGPIRGTIGPLWFDQETSNIFTG